MEKTVLILGAGFSIPYGYPSGPTLVDEIIQHYGKPGNNGPLQKMAKQLSDSGAISIDRFLSSKSDHLNAGLQAIAARILAAEKQSLLFDVKPDTDILKLLLNQVDEEMFANLTIVTFNYDRLLEWKLLRKIRIYSNSDAEACQRLNRLRIEHVHGRLPPLNYDEASLDSSSDSCVIPYGMLGAQGVEEEWDFIREGNTHATKSLKTIFTNNQEPNPIAVEAIKRANRIFFLGFSFDEMNMRKLGISAPSITIDWASKCVAGTSLGMSRIEMKKVYDLYPFLRERLFDVNCRELFTNYFSLRESRYDHIFTNKVNRSCCELTALQNRPANSHPNTVSYWAEVTCIECHKTNSFNFRRDEFDGPWYLS